MQVQGLVGLHDALRFAALIAQQQVHRAVALDVRTAHHGDPLRQPRQVRGAAATPGGAGLDGMVGRVSVVAMHKGSSPSADATS